MVGVRLCRSWKQLFRVLAALLTAALLTAALLTAALLKHWLADVQNPVVEKGLKGVMERAASSLSHRSLRKFSKYGVCPRNKHESLSNSNIFYQF